ncbi:MFS transporter [Sphingomonas sp.]|uniref:MFS transporter n=1 Tax=Sphingomonas sp. TaxID=28214 RepID=UPI001D8902EF|nr:MFS transporter [Sphingomonas sp.]MBX9796293.1 MFS transporter [Sphingomonas sp.]
MTKPRLSLFGILQMNLGFLGLQFSFGLQQSNMGPIYAYLGADEAAMPLLWLAGPMTGLIVQPIVGAMSDRTRSRLGRRTPYFLVGAVLCSLSLFAMPYSRALWMAASLLWVLDAANNITMEPYRAYVSDRLSPAQLPLGFLTQSAFTGLAQTLSFLAPSLLVWWGVGKDVLGANGIPEITRLAFVIGAVLSLATILWSVTQVPELPLTAAEDAAMPRARLTLAGTFAELRDAIAVMPRPMRQLALAMFCQWFAMFCYWQYAALSLARGVFGTADPASQGFRDAALLNGQLGACYNAVACIAAFAMVPFTRRYGARAVHAVAVVAAGLGTVTLALSSNVPLLFVAMLGVGIGWGSIMGNPYVILSDAIPPERTGVYMGIFNMFIVIPMLVQTLLIWLAYRPLLGGDPRHVMLLAGGLLMLAGATTMAVRERGAAPASA